MTATSDFIAVPPPVGPGSLAVIIPWILWIVLFGCVAVMAVIGGVLVAPRGRRYLREKDRNAPGQNVKLVVGCGVGAVQAGVALLILQWVSS
ncbi:hypothetical protein [Rhodococcus erythropolis]|nr:hypothetical protein [Rhodococcus erythropolis]